MSVDIDEFCAFCAFLPSDGLILDAEPELSVARENVERTGMADPVVEDPEDDWWSSFVDKHMAPDILERKRVFREDFAEMVAGFQRGALDEAQLAAAMKAARNRFFGVREGEDGPEPWEREWRRSHGEPY